MVLSNKKKKEQLRAGILNGNGPEASGGSLGSKTSNSLGILMNPLFKKSTLSKREKRRQRLQLEKPGSLNHNEISCSAEGKKEDELAAKPAVVGASAAELNGDGPGDLDPKTSHSLGILVNPLSSKPNLSKREKRKKLPQLEKSDSPSHEEINGGAEVLKEGEVKSDVAEGKSEDELKLDATGIKTKKKRRWDETKRLEKANEKKEERLKKKNKKRVKKKSKTNNVENEPIKENIEQQRELNGEQLLPKSDEILKRYCSRSEDAELSGRVYVGGIPYYSSEDDIRSYFEPCGTITSLDCMTFPDTGKFRGIAIISFKTDAAAKRALALDGSDMGGLFLKIQPYNKSAKPNRTTNFAPSILEGYNRIYIGNLSWDITEDDLRKLFCDCTIASLRFGQDKETKEFKGYGHVDFADSVSLSKALKLDQSVVCGRPVRITCALPKNAGLNNSKSIPNDNPSERVKVSTVNEEPSFTPNNHVENAEVTPVYEDQVNSGAMNVTDSKIKRRSCYVCGEKGHLSSSCLKKQVTGTTNHGAFAEGDDSSVWASGFNEDKSNSSGMNVTDPKIKRRSCYICGEKGHLSSSCPKNQVTETNAGEFINGQLSSVGFGEDKSNSSEMNVSDSKVKRRTCYVCGEKGHLSSSCTKNQAAELTNCGEVSEKQVNEFLFEDKYNISVTNASDSKIRRRTCYECGEKGHLSSACPKNQPAVAVNEVPVSKTNEYQDSIFNVSEDKVNESAINSKIRRRTCYECGEKGHLSSACPKIQAAK